MAKLSLNKSTLTSLVPQELTLVIAAAANADTKAISNCNMSGCADCARRDSDYCPTYPNTLTCVKCAGY